LIWQPLRRRSRLLSLLFLLLMLLLLLVLLCCYCFRPFFKSIFAYMYTHSCFMCIYGIFHLETNIDLLWRTKSGCCASPSWVGVCMCVRVLWLSSRRL